MIVHVCINKNGKVIHIMFHFTNYFSTFIAHMYSIAEEGRGLLTILAIMGKNNRKTVRESNQTCFEYNMEKQTVLQ